MRGTARRSGVRPRAREPAPGAGGRFVECLDENTLDEFVTGRLRRAQRRDVEVHVDGCGDCRELVANHLKQSYAQFDEPTVVERRRGIGTAPTLRMLRGPDGDEVDSPLLRPRFSPNTVVGHRYRLDRFIASGGMAEVWRAIDTQLDIPVAVKLLGESFAQDPEVVARFQREAKAAARLRSPHVVAILGLGMHERVPYIAMELLDGEDLDARLDKRGRLSLAETEQILRQAARAIQRAHDEGIVHRDLKPSNIFLARSDGREVVKILDFGIAKITAGISTGSLTRTGQIMGTLHYMSPEQAIGDRHVDHRSDLWSLAMIVFRMVTGELGVEAESVAEAINKIVHGEVALASAIAPELPLELDGFFARAFAFSRDKRFQTADEMAQAFTEIIASSETRRAPARVPALPPPVEPPRPLAPAAVLRPAPPPLPSPTILVRPGASRGRIGAVAVALVGLFLVLVATAAVLIVQRRDSARAPDAAPSPGASTATP